MTDSDTRRNFLKKSSAATAAAVAVSAGPNLLLGQAKGANSRMRVGVMGLSRGRGHIKGYLDVPNCEVAYVCEVDETRLAAGVKYANDQGAAKPPKGVGNFREILDDPEIDALSIAAPNFWHAPATIYACQAGKHVYVEKPGSYNGYESKRMVQVAEETGRKVQMGTQRRSYPGILEGIAKLEEGIIGKRLYARCFYSGARPSIGKGKIGAPPANLDWALWQGPLPEKPFKSNIHPYNWHWHWFYGGGELANNGVHSLDVARWAMGTEEHPTRVTCNGGRYRFDDDQETPDTAYATFDYGGKFGISWESSSCHPRKPEKLSFVRVYGEGGMLDFSSSNYTAYDIDGKEIGQNRDQASDVPHFTNFADAIREDKPLNQPISSGQKSTLLCHLGNIAYRTSGGVDVNPQTGELVDNPEAQKLWARESYRDGWTV